MAELLGQQELMEPSPLRRIIVPRGRGAWWGVDPSTTRVAVAFVDGEGRRGVRTAPFAPDEGPARLAGIYRETGVFVASLVAEAEWPLPGLVHVEQPSGKVDNPTLLYAVGCIQAAVYAALAWDLGAFGPARLETVASAHWKKVACGKGNIYKPTKKKLGRTPVFEDYGVAVWAQENGYDGRSWDEADAWGIAEAARREVELVQR